MSIPYLPLYVADYEADTSHLTLEEDGAYSRLLRLCWRTPGCSIPDDEAWIMRRLRVDRETFDRVVRPVLDEFFTAEKARLFSRRLRDEHARIENTQRARSEAGRKGGRPAKSLKSKDQDESRAKAKRKQNESIYNQNQNHNSVSNETDAGGVDFEAALFSNGVRFLIARGVAERQARSIIGRWRKDHDDADIFRAFCAAKQAGAVDPVGYIGGVLRGPQAVDINEIFKGIGNA